MDTTDPLVVASRLVADRFPGAGAAFLGGSVLTSRRTATSDLDIVVVLDPGQAPFRGTVRRDGWVVELFVHTPSSLRHYWDMDASARRTPLLRMCAEGRVLVSRDGDGERIASEAVGRLTSGPTEPSEEVLRMRRYLLTDLLDDLRGSSDPVEDAYVAAGLVTAASELVLLVANAWAASGKWLPRRVTEVDPRLPHRLVSAQHAVAHGDKVPLETVVTEVLERAGGPLTEGLRLAGEDPETRAT